MRKKDLSLNINFTVTVEDEQINRGYFKIQQKFCDSVATLQFAVVGISFLSSLPASRKVLLSREAKSSSESYCISSFTSLLLIPSNIFFFL